MAFKKQPPQFGKKNPFAKTVAGKDLGGGGDSEMDMKEPGRMAERKGIRSMTRQALVRKAAKKSTKKFPRKSSRK